MMGKILIGLFWLTTTSIFAQSSTSGRLSFEFGFNQNQFKMLDLNQFYVDEFASQVNPKLLDEGITSGQSLRLGLQYRPVGIFDVGLYTLYQSGETSSNPQFTQRDEFGMIIARPIGQFSIRTEAISFGLISNIFISHFLNFSEKKRRFLNSSHVSIELQGGWGYSRIVADLQRPDQPIFSTYDFFSSQAFQGTTGLKYSYDITRNNLISSIGFRFGYQFFKTGTVEDRLGDEWVIQGENPISLDFSGLYYGVIVGLGK